MKVYIPDTFHPQYVDHGEDIAVFLNEILVRQTYKRENISYGSPVAITHEHMRRLMNWRRFTKVLDICLNKDFAVIAGAHNFSPGALDNHGNEYALGGAFNNARGKSYTLTDEYLIRKRSAVYDWQRESLPWYDIYDDLKQDLQKVELTGVTDSQIRDIAGKSAREKLERGQKLSQKRINQSYIPIHTMCERFWARDYFFTPDISGRVHTNITNLHSEVRPYLKFNGQNIKWLDICNAQLLFLALICLFLSNANRFNNYLSHKIDYLLTSTSTLYNTNSSTPLLSAPPNLIYISQQNSLEQFLKKCLKPGKNSIYYEAHEWIGKDKCCDNIKQTKKGVLAVLFDNINEQNIYQKFYKSNYPEVYYLMNEVKRQNVRALTEDEILSGLSQHHHWYRLLQGLESDIVIHEICPTFKSLCDGPILTLHDAFGTTEEYMPYLQRSLDIVRERIGVNIPVK